MKRTNKIYLITILAISAGLYACNSGNNNSTNPQVLGFLGGDYGPIPVNMYSNLLAARLNPVTTNQSLKGAGGAADTAAATGVMAAVFPPAAVVLGPISAISGLVAADQVAAQINQINNELNYQESQIQQIYAILNASYTYFIEQSLVSDLTAFQSSYTNWYNGTVGIALFYGYNQDVNQTGIGGNQISSWYQGYMNNILTQDPNYPTGSIESGMSQLLENVAMNPDTMSGINQFLGGAPDAATINTILGDIDNASSTSTANAQDNISALQIVPESGSLTNQMLMNAQSTLLLAIPIESIPNPQFINVVESYNNFVNSVYLANVSVLQATYALEANNNYLNYLNFLAAESNPALLSQICPIEGNSPSASNVYNTINFYAGSGTRENGGCGKEQVATTVYFNNGYNGANSSYQTLNPQNAESALIFAQQQLAQLYARRINSLYQQMISYIYSDYQYTDQRMNLPSGEKTLSTNMANIMASTKQVKMMSSSVPGQHIIAGNWINGADLYQYPITNLDIESALIESAINSQLSVNPNIFPVIPTINDSNYPPVYQNIQAGYYDGESLSIYNSYTAVTTNRFNFNGYCNSFESGLSIINPALYCNNWSGSIMANSTTLNANLDIESVPNMISLMYTPLYMNYGGTSYQYYPIPNEYCTFASSTYCIDPMNNIFTGSYNSWFRMTNNPSDSYTYYVADNSLNNDFMLLASSSYNNSTPGFSLGSGEFFTSGTGPSFQLEDDGFQFSGGGYYQVFSHSALLQVTLPNGYNLPFYVFSYIDYGTHTYSSPICPSVLGVSVSGITSCTQQNAGNGGLQITTVDGNTFYLNVLQPSDGQGYQYGFFQISTTAQTNS